MKYKKFIIYSIIASVLSITALISGVLDMSLLLLLIGILLLVLRKQNIFNDKLYGKTYNKK